MSDSTEITYTPPTQEELDVQFPDYYDYNIGAFGIKPDDTSTAYVKVIVDNNKRRNVQERLFYIPTLEFIYIYDNSNKLSNYLELTRYYNINPHRIWTYQTFINLFDKNMRDLIYKLMKANPIEHYTNIPTIHSLRVTQNVLWLIERLSIEWIASLKKNNTGSDVNRSNTSIDSLLNKVFVTPQAASNVSSIFGSVGLI